MKSSLTTKDKKAHKEEISITELEESDSNFIQSNISIVREDFQIINKKRIWFSGIEQKLQKLLDMDLSILWKNLKKIRDDFDQVFANTGNMENAILALNNNKNGRILLFQTPEIKTIFSNSLPNFYIYAKNFCLQKNSELYFDLIFEIQNPNDNINHFGLYHYFHLKEISSIKQGNIVTVDSVPCNEPVVTKYADVFFYNYKQLVKFYLHKYILYNINKSFRSYYWMKKEIKLNIKQDLKDFFAKTLDKHLIKNNPNLRLNGTKYNIWKLWLWIPLENCYFTLELNEKNLEISFFNTPFELAEYWYAKILEALDTTNHIINKKYKLKEYIIKTKENLFETLEKEDPDAKNRSELIKKNLLSIQQQFLKCYNKWDTIESPIFLQYIEDVLSFEEQIATYNIIAFEDKSYDQIVSFYADLFNNLIYGSDNIRKIIDSDKGGLEAFVTKRLELISGIKLIADFYFRTNPFDNISSINYDTIWDMQNYKDLIVIVINWLKDKNKEKLLSKILCNFTKNIVKKEFFPYLFLSISKWQGNNLETLIDECTNKYIWIIPNELINIVKDALWNYGFVNTIFYLKINLEENKGKIDFSLLDQFANKKVYTDKININGDIQITNYAYETSNKQYYDRIIQSLSYILKGESEIKLESLDLETLKKEVVKFLYPSFLTIYLQWNINTENYNLFLEYLNKKEIQELKKSKAKKEFRSYIQNIKEIFDNPDLEEVEFEEESSDDLDTEVIELSEEGQDIDSEIFISEQNKIIEKFEKLNLDKYEQIIGELVEYCDKNEIIKYKRKFRQTITNYVLKEYYKKLQNNINFELNQDLLDRILSYLDEKDIKEFKNKIELIKVKYWVKQDIANIKSWIIDINTDKYQEISVKNQEIRERFKELVLTKQKYDKSYILENPKSDIKSIINWYHIWKEKLPDLIEKIITNLENIHSKWDKSQQLFILYDKIIKSNETYEKNDDNIQEFLNALGYYIDSLCIEIENLTEKEIEIIENSTNIVMNNLYDENNKLKNLKKIIEFLIKIKNLSDDETYILDKILEFYTIEELFPEKDLKYIHVMLGIIKDISDNLYFKTTKNIIQTIFKHIVIEINILDKDNKLSYEQIEQIIEKLENIPISTYIDLDSFKTSKFIIMLKYISEKDNSKEN